MLAAVTCRGHVERDHGVPAAKDTHGRLLAWFGRLALWQVSEPEERHLFEAPLGSLLEREYAAATWRVEGLLVLAWAIGLTPLLPHDTEVDPFALTSALHLLQTDAMEVLAASTLRDARDLRVCREFYDAVHVRLREFRRHPEGKDDRHAYETGWAARLGLPCPLLRGDLAVGGQPIESAAPSAVRIAERIVTERHRAAIWLLGEEGASYTGFTVDT
ncbi:MAG: DUF4272 domain-containing protein [Myxococcales bacterium]|nr:DUF4272 domain-containing protein [Myxococcales bacterium]